LFMKRSIVACFILLLAGAFMMVGCEKETVREIVSSTEYDTLYDSAVIVDTIFIDTIFIDTMYDSTTVYDTIMQYDSTTVYDTIMQYDSTTIYDTIIAVNTILTDSGVYTNSEVIYYAAVVFAQRRTSHQWKITPPMGEDLIGLLGQCPDRDLSDYVGIPIDEGNGTFKIKGQFQYIDSRWPGKMQAGIYECVIAFDIGGFRQISMIM